MTPHYAGIKAVARVIAQSTPRSPNHEISEAGYRSIAAQAIDAYKQAVPETSQCVEPRIPVRLLTGTLPARRMYYETYLTALPSKGTFLFLTDEEEYMVIVDTPPTFRRKTGRWDVYVIVQAPDHEADVEEQILFDTGWSYEKK